MTMAIMMEPAAAPWLRELNRLFTSESAPSPFLPAADVLVGQEDVRVYMDVPGLRAGDLEIELEQDTLTIRGERPYPYDDAEQGVWRRIERSFGRFERALRVPVGLDPDQVHAALADGVLTLTIPRPQPPQPRRVQIAASEEPGQTPQAQTQQDQPQQQEQPQQDPAPA
jgi:HSP20 family protein